MQTALSARRSLCTTGPRSRAATNGHGEAPAVFAFPGAQVGGRFITLRPSSLLVPLIGFISVGLGSAVLYLLRLALYSPDVSWDRKNNPEPWNKLGPTDQYKFMAVSTDYKSLKKDRPSF
uniref:NADH dehydrogenase [ubiquinone] 1 alpha subcomplex subunit 4-like 2 n=1 Tax=Anas zonorhyncha TaxID=75864 RepID=A0A8B9ZVH9_9AVES